jgi:Bacterial PH domain
VQWNGFSAALATSGTPGVIVSLVLGSPWGYATAIAATVAAVWSTRRAFRIRLTVTNEGVTVVNHLRSHSLSWPEIQSVGIDWKGFFPRPGLGFKLREGGAVFAQATPLRRGERQAFQEAVLRFAPQSADAVPDRAGIMGTDRALSNRLLLWWLRNQAPSSRIEERDGECVWREEPFPFTLFFVTSGVVVSGLVAVLGVWVLISAPIDNASAVQYLVGAGFLVVGTATGTALARILSRGARAT